MPVRTAHLRFAAPPVPADAKAATKKSFPAADSSHTAVRIAPTRAGSSTEGVKPIADCCFRARALSAELTGPGVAVTQWAADATQVRPGDHRRLQARPRSECSQTRQRVIRRHVVATACDSGLRVPGAARGAPAYLGPADRWAGRESGRFRRTARVQRGGAVARRS